MLMLNLANGGVNMLPSYDSNTTYVNVKQILLCINSAPWINSNTTYVNVKRLRQDLFGAGELNSNTTYVNVKQSVIFCLTGIR